MTTFQNAFISYGRADSKAFAAQLNQQLMAAGLTVWVDFEDIPLGVDYQKQIDDGIDKADNFLFIISPHAINSPYCRLEIELALKRGKRIIPLLHVEEVTRETWQQRNSSGTDEQWAAHQAAGKHSCFPNMHPAISRINWVYFREGIDDFASGLQGLLAIFERQKDYVRQHTELLVAALTWEQNQKRTQYLLTGQQRQQAEVWLHTRFSTEQPPCVPTDLHCEFITASNKNAQNLMTQVFLAHAETDAEVMDQIRRALQREGITVWTSATDIRSGEDFQQAIRRGIEQADNLVYLLSPAAQASEFCQQELDYARSLHKRLIPVLVSTTDEDAIPKALQGMQYIEWKAVDAEDSASIDVGGATPKEYRPLLKALKDDAAYFNEHKVLLTQALKWERQQRNPSILLQGYNLRHAAAWLKVAQTRSRHQPTALQTEFLQESLRQPPAQSLDVFISYSRVDSDFARRLNEALQIQGKRTWFDQESIALGADFQQEIYRGIETSDHFLFILSPEAVNSPYCADEVEYAHKLHKRVVTVRHRAIDTSDLHPVLASIQWIDFRKQDGDFNANFKELLRTLESDREHLEAHTRLLVRALEWEKKNQSTDLLLRGQELEAVIAWLTQNAEKEPRSSQIQRDYINASRLEAATQQQAQLEHEATVRKRITRALIAAVGGFVIAVGLGAAAFQQFRRAETQRQEAVQAEVEALISSANALLDSEQPLDALVESLKAANQLDKSNIQGTDLDYRVAGTLHRVIASTYESNRLLDHAHWVEAVAFSPEGNVFATAGRDGAVRIWSNRGQYINTIQGKKGEQAFGLNFSPDGHNLVITAGESIKLLDASGHIVRRFAGHSHTVIAASFSPNGQLIASAAADGSIGLWNLDGTLLNVWQAHAWEIKDIQFSPDGDTLASASIDGSVKIWTQAGELLNTFTGNSGLGYRVSFSPGGELLASAGADGLKLWNRSGELVKYLEIDPDNYMYAVGFSPDGQTLAVAPGEHNTILTAIRLLSLEGDELRRFGGHGSRITDVDFSADGQHLVSTSFDGTVRLWQTDKEEAVMSVQGHTDKVTSLSLSPNGQTLASSSQDGSIILWNSEGQIVETLENHSEAVNTIAFSPSGDELFSGSDDKTVNVWTQDGKLQTTLEGHEAAIKSLSISPDGKFLASVSEDGNVKLWTSQGELLKELTVDEGYADIVRFHPEASLIAVSVDQFNQENRNVLLWDWQGESVTTLNPTGQFAVTDMHFSPTGDSLAVVSWHGNVSFWNLAGEKLNSFFAGYAGPVNAIQFSPGGSALAVGSQSLMLFNLQGELQQMLELPEQGEISSLAFETDGQKIITGQTDGSILTWNMNASELVQKGCRRLENYLISHPEILVELSLCQTPSRLTQAADTLVKRGEFLALQGNESDAVEAFKQALELNPQADLVPEEIAASLASRGQTSHLLEEGDHLAHQGDRAAALEKYQAAIALDSTLTLDAEARFHQEEVIGAVEQLIDEGRELARQGEVTAAKAKFQAAKDREPNLALNPERQARYFAADRQFTQAQTALNTGDISEAITAITKVQQLDSNLLNRNPQFLSDVCWQSSLEGKAESVIKICDEAVSLGSERPAMRDSRGLARALTGDVAGAIADFQFFIDNTSDETAKAQRQQWIQQLEAGTDPFTAEVLESL